MSTVFVRFARLGSVVLAAFAVAVCHTALAASLSLLATWSGRGFNVSHSGDRFAAWSSASVCVYSIANPARARTCTAVPVDPASVEPRVHWAPDDSALAVSGEDETSTPGI